MLANLYLKCVTKVVKQAQIPNLNISAKVIIDSKIFFLKLQPWACLSAYFINID